MITKSIHFDLKAVSQKCEEYAAVFKIVAVHSKTILAEFVDLTGFWICSTRETTWNSSNLDEAHSTVVTLPSLPVTTPGRRVKANGRTE